MRKLLLGAAAISLSGCSFLGIGGHNSHYAYQSGPSWGNQHANVGSSCHSSHAVLANGKCLSRFSVEGGIGINSQIGGGTFLTGDEAVAVGTDIGKFSTRDIYDPGLQAEAGLSYAINPYTKVTAMGYISEGKSDGNVSFGSIGAQPLTGEISDFESKGIELGLRRYFNPTAAPGVNSIRPYIEGRVGAAHIDEIEIRNAELGGAAFAGGTLGLYESDWVPSAAGLIGFETPLTSRSTVGFETGLRYTGKPDANTTGQFAPGQALEGVNDGGARWSVPLMLRGRYRF
ncbi:MAG: hypothetical protein AAFP97_03075 [Pseudomonadota bacterium]